MIADAKTKVYGDADPSLTYQVSVLVELLDPGDVLVQAHVGEVGKLGGVGLAERMIGAAVLSGRRST